MVIERNYYLNKLIFKRENGLIKVITGIRRCRKSFLLFELYRNYLRSAGGQTKILWSLHFMKLKNVDLYVTGSNSKMLFSDILTEFKDRVDEIHVNPLSYSEFYDAYERAQNNAWQEYLTYGGMPLILS